MNLKLSLKALKELQANIGGVDAGFHITIYGQCIETKQHINVQSRIAYAQRSDANWSYILVRKY